MEPDRIEDTSGPARPGGTRRGWWIHWGILALYPPVVGGLGALTSSSQRGPLLSPDPGMLLFSVVTGLGFFGCWFLVAWLASRADADQLMLRNWNGARAVWRGLGYSVALRLAIGGVALAAVAVALACGLGNPDLAESLRPRHEKMVDAQALVQSPVYLWLNVILVSFVLAGGCEELWRAGMLAGYAALFPGSFKTRRGQALAIGLAAVIFGSGHATQGPGGMAMTTLLGFGLGMIMLRHRSIWEAVLAHGFFNATTFGLVYLLAKYRPEALT